MATIRLNGQVLYYTQPMKVAGGPVLLLIHGAGANHLVWPKEIQRLPGTTVYNLDLPGHGRSPGPGRSGIDGYADVVQDFIGLLMLQNVTIVGHSMGGAIAQALALRKLQQISRIVIVNSGAKLRVSPDILENVLVDPDIAVDFVLDSSWGSAAPDALLELGKRSMQQMDQGVLHGDFLACDNFDVRARLDQIRIPALIISSTEDKMTPLKYGRFLADNIANAQLLIIEGAGHFSILENPKMVANRIAEFLGIGKL
jgi:pimeloyl-ACP methyl ester carboxylesterase